MNSTEHWRPGTASAAWSASYPHPLVLRVGELVTILPRESEWEGWLWCVDAAGKGGWVPRICLDADAGLAEVLEDYDAAELDVRPGDVLQLGRRYGGWIRCRDANGREGWIPEDCVTET